MSYLKCGLLIAVSLVALAGCGGSGNDSSLNTVAPAIKEALEAMPSRLADAAGNAEKMKDLVVEGAIPADQQAKYRQYQFIGSDAKITGDNATLKVRIEQNEKEVGTKDWEIVKESNGTWKIKSAPLP